MGTMQWLRHFEKSVSRPRTFDWGRGVHLPDATRGPIIASLQMFQRGLSSPGHDLRTKVHQHCPPEYAEAIDLYVREKNVHADLLVRLLWAAGATPGKRSMSDFLFRRFRRRFDWAAEIMVLLTAEMASMPFFRILANSSGDPLIRQVVESILVDQSFHLGFHIDQLRAEMEARTNTERVVLQQTWHAFFLGALGVVLRENRETFEVLRYSKLAYWTDANNLFAQVQTGLHGSAHLSALLTRDPRIRFVV